MEQIDDNKGADSASVASGGAGTGKQTCSKCGERKRHNEFYSRAGKPDRICKECKKSAQKDHYRKKTVSQNAEFVVGNLLNKVLDYKIMRAKMVKEELRRLLEECEAEIRQNRLARAS